MRLFEYLTSTNVIISIMLLSFITVIVIPEICYAINVVDRHYFGYYFEREPIYAKTTANQKYYSEHNIPYVTSADIKKDYERIRFNRSKGLPVHYELNHK